MDTCIGTVCIVGAHLIALDVGYTNHMPTSATSYDGVERDISRFYEDQQTNYTIDAAFYLNTNTRLTLGMDNGIKTSKYSMRNNYRIGVDQWITDNIMISGWRQQNGKIEETPCTDNYQRQYYCGNLTAWSDYQGVNNEDSYKATVTYRYRFGS